MALAGGDTATARVGTATRCGPTHASTGPGASILVVCGIATYVGLGGDCSMDPVKATK